MLTDTNAAAIVSMNTAVDPAFDALMIEETRRRNAARRIVDIETTILVHEGESRDAADYASDLHELACQAGAHEAATIMARAEEFYSLAAYHREQARLYRVVAARLAA